MLLITANQPQRLLRLDYVQRVSPAELAAGYDELKALVADLPSGFRLLADLSQVEFMEPDCMTELGRAMELIGQHGVGLIVRVIPDPAKDIGMNMAQIQKDMKGPEVKATLDEDMKLAEVLGLNGTPSYVIGSDVVVGAIGLPGLQEKVNTARCGKPTC